MAAPLIAHIVHRLDYGGLENGLVNLINRLPSDRYRHAVVCLTGATEFRQRIQRPDVTVHELHKTAGKDPGAYRRLWQLLRRLRPAAVHTRNTGLIDCQLVGALAGVGIRIHGYHGWDVGDLTGSDPRQNRLRRLCDPFVGRYVVVSRQIRDWLITTQGVAPGRITQIYNGVDTERFRPRRERRAGNPPMPFVIGTVGRLQPVKNQILLVRACAELLGRHPALHPRLRLVIAGDGPDRGMLAEAVNHLGLAEITRFTGWRDDVAAVLQGLDVFVLPSLNEGISNTVLEAMASGLPVLATAVGGNTELVVEGETGCLMPVDDPAVLAERLALYARSPGTVQEHGVAARRRVEREFSLTRMVGDYDRLYTALIRIPEVA